MDYHNKLTEYIMWSLEYHILNFFSGPIAVYCARRVCGGDAASARVFSQTSGSTCRSANTQRMS